MQDAWAGTSYDKIDAKNLADHCCIIEIPIHRILMAGNIKVGYLNLFKLKKLDFKFIAENWPFSKKCELKLVHVELE